MELYQYICVTLGLHDEVSAGQDSCQVDNYCVEGAVVKVVALRAAVCGCYLEDCCVEGHSVGGCGVEDCCEERVYI